MASLRTQSNSSMSFLCWVPITEHNTPGGVYIQYVWLLLMFSCLSYTCIGLAFELNICWRWFVKIWKVGQELILVESQMFDRLNHWTKSEVWGIYFAKSRRWKITVQTVRMFFLTVIEIRRSQIATFNSSTWTYLYHIKRKYVEIVLNQNFSGTE